MTFQPVNSAGQPVQLSAAEAHVNVELYLATLHSDQLFTAGKLGPPAEISGFALLSNTAATSSSRWPSTTACWTSQRAKSRCRSPARHISTRWTRSPGARRTDGVPDLVVGLAGPVANASDLIFG